MAWYGENGVLTLGWQNPAVPDRWGVFVLRSTAEPVAAELVDGTPDRNYATPVDYSARPRGGRSGQRLRRRGREPPETTTASTTTLAIDLAFHGEAWLLGGLAFAFHDGDEGPAGFDHGPPGQDRLAA